MTDRDKRCAKVNDLLQTISASGRQFFRHENHVAHLEVRRGRVFFIDHYTRKRVYTHYRGRWRGFTGGGALRGLVEHLRDFVARGPPVPSGVFGPWHESLCDGDLWGYGDDMARVRDKARDLGIIAEVKS